MATIADDTTGARAAGMIEKTRLLSCAALVFLAFAIGLFFEGFRDIHYAPAILSLLLFSCIAILPAFRHDPGARFEIPNAPAAIALFSLWLYVTISLSWSSVPFASLVTYIIFIAGPLTFFAILLAPDRQELAKAVFLALLGGLALLSLWAVAQVVFFSPVYGPRAHHPFPSANNLAALLNLGLLPALALFIAAEDKSRLRHLFLGLSLLFFAGLLATQSRGGFLSALAAASVLFVTLWKPPFFRRRILVFLAPAMLLFLGQNMVTHFEFAVRLASLGAPAADENSLARLTVWANAWRMFMDHFWIGTGLGTFYLYYPSYRLPGADNSSGNWAHMDPLQYGAEMGVLAPVLFYAAGLAVLARTIRALKTASPGAQEHALVAGSFCALLALILHSHVDFHLYVMPVLIVTGAWLALWYTATGATLGNGFAAPDLANWQKPLMAGLVLITASMIALMAVSSAAGQVFLLQAQGLIRKGLTEQFVAKIEEAERWAPRSFIDPELHLAALYIDLLDKDAAALFTIPEQQSLYIQTLSLLDNTAKMSPPWAEPDYKRGLLYARINTGFEPQARRLAVESFEHAIQKNPMHFGARYELSVLYMQEGRAAQAYDILAQGLLYPHAPAVTARYRGLMDRIESLATISRSVQKQKEEPQ